MVKILFYIYFDVVQLLWSSLLGYHWHVSYCKYEGGASLLLYDCVSTFYLQTFYSSRKKLKKKKNHRHIKIKSANWEWQDERNRITHSGERKLCTMTSMYCFTPCVCLISSWCVHFYSIFLTLCMFSCSKHNSRSRSTYNSLQRLCATVQPHTFANIFGPRSYQHKWCTVKYQSLWPVRSSGHKHITTCSLYVVLCIWQIKFVCVYLIDQ